MEVEVASIITAVAVSILLIIIIIMAVLTMVAAEEVGCAVSV